MKTTKSLLAGLIFLSSVTASVTAFAADGVVEKDRFVAGSYCNQKFQAMEEQSLDTNEPVLKNNDIIDFYGDCNESPVGQDQVQEQKLDLQHRFVIDFESE